LDRDARIVELGEMLGGASTGSDGATLASAAELLDRAAAWHATEGAAG
jgi:hypothetical protein